VSKHWSPKRGAKVVGFRRPAPARKRRRRRRGLGIGRDDLIGMALIGLVIGGTVSFTGIGDRAIPAGIAGERAIPAQVRVIDGDTFDYRGIRVRVADIDTPEVRGQCDHEIRLAARATQRMRTLLAAGPFELHPLSNGRDEDRYGRKLRIVTRDGRSLGDQLVAEGLARTWSGRRERWC
jgi:micrococcal nuclease